MNICYFQCKYLALTRSIKFNKNRVVSNNTRNTKNLDHQELIIDRPWEAVVEGIHDRHELVPNPDFSDIIATEFCNFAYDSNSQISSFERRDCILVHLPSWVKMIINFKYVVSHSICFIDRANKIFEADSSNISFSNFVELHDKGRYTPNPNNPNQTLKVLDTSVNVKALPIPGIHHKVNELVLSKYFEGLINSDKSDLKFIERRIMQGVANETSPEIQAKCGKRNPLYFGHYSFFKEVDDNEKIQKLLLEQRQMEIESKQSQQRNRFFDTPKNSFDD